MQQMLISLLKNITLGYILLAFTFWFVADRILFQPPLKTKLPLAHEVSISLANHHRISAVYLPNPTARYTILFSHGNAEDLKMLFPYLQLLHRQGFAVLAYDYPGYGTSTGDPSETSTYQAITAAYEYLTKTLSITPKNIIVFGRSLGTGPSIELAANASCAGLILESPFVSAYRVYTLWPIFPFDRYENLRKIAKVTAPILLIHGTHDNVIPVWHGQKLFAAALAPKQAYWVNGASHNDVLNVAKNHYWETIHHFVGSL